MDYVHLQFMSISGLERTNWLDVNVIMGLVLYREWPIFTLNCHILHVVRASSLQAWQQMLLEGYQSLLGKPKVERDTGEH